MNEVRVINKTPPITIPFKQQYNLKHGLFDPLQNSPPSVWKERLNKRLSISKTYIGIISPSNDSTLKPYNFYNNSH